MRSMLATVALAAPLMFGALPTQAQPDLNAMVDEVEPRVLAWRRHVHQNPELSAIRK